MKKFVYLLLSISITNNIFSAQQRDVPMMGSHLGIRSQPEEGQSLAKRQKTDKEEKIESEESLDPISAKNKSLEEILEAQLEKQAELDRYQDELLRDKAIQENRIKFLDELISELVKNAYIWTKDEISEQIDKIKTNFTNDIAKDVRLHDLNKLGVHRTPLIKIAAHAPLNDLAFWLIDNGADIDKKSEDLIGNTPLKVAIANRNIELVKYLVNNGATVNYDKYGRSPLFSVFANMSEFDEIDKEIVKTLLINGAKFKNDEAFKRLFLDLGYGLVIKRFQSKHDRWKEQQGIPDISQWRAPATKPFLDQILAEIAKEYRRKMAYLKPDDVMSKLSLKDRKISDDQIIDNIVEIRKMLGELDEEGRAYAPQAQQAAAAPQAK